MKLAKNNSLNPLVPASLLEPQAQNVLIEPGRQACVEMGVISM